MLQKNLALKKQLKQKKLNFIDPILGVQDNLL